MIWEDDIVVDENCPFCNHERGTSGSVTATGDGSFTCADCGSHWRDLNSNSQNFATASPKMANPKPANGEPPGKESKNGGNSHIPRINRQKATADRPDAMRNREPDKPPGSSVAQARFDGEQTDHHQLGRKGATSIPPPANSVSDLVLMGATAFFVSLVLMACLYWFLQTGNQAVARGDILIENVSFERTGSGKTELIRVNGTLINRSHNTQQVPELRMVLKSREDREVFSWLYQSTKATIPPGDKLQFSSLMSAGGLPFKSIQVVTSD